jgi:putative membrane protein
MWLSPQRIGAHPDVPESDAREALSMSWDHMNGWGSTMIAFWSLIWVGFLGLIAWLAVPWTRNSLRGPLPSQPSVRTAKELLDERLARGQIDVDEYERRRDALTPVGV